MTILGTSGNDTLTNTTGSPDTIDGLAGDDSIVGTGYYSNPRGASDVVLGGDGNDTLRGAASLYGEGGDDSIWLDSGFADGGDGADSIRIINVAGANTVFGGAGDDVIDGASYYMTQVASNLFSGGDGNDRLNGGHGADTLLGGAGDDFLRDAAGGMGGEIAGPGYQDGGAGNDTLQTAGFTSGSTLTGGEGSDLFLIMDASGSPDVITDFAAGTDGDVVVLPFFSADGLLRQQGSDVVWLPYANSSPVIRFQDVIVTDFVATNFLYGTLPDHDYAPGRVIGTSDSDAVALRAISDGVQGGPATPTGDTISALQGADTVDADAGNDQVWGGSGDDSLLGQDGADTLGGAAGDDTILGGADADQIMGSDGEDLLDGGDGADTLSGGAGSDTLVGGAGDDVFYAGTDTASDSVDGGEGHDSAWGSAGADWMDLGAGDDFVRAGGGQDTILGGAGADTLFGGTGSDALVGGADADVFRLDADMGSFDVILDFSGGPSGEGDRLLVGSAATRAALVASATGDATQTVLSAHAITVVLVGVDVGTVSADWFLIG